MDILFLGTSSGTPTKTRNVTGLALLEEKGKAWYLIDCGEGTQHQLLHTPLSLNDLQAVFITHVHGDHCYGLPGLLASAGMSGRRSPLQIIAPISIKAWFDATQQHTQLHLPFDVHFVETESLHEWSIGNVDVSAIALSHRVPSYAYSFTETHIEANLDTQKLIMDGIPKGPLWGKLQRGIDIEFEGSFITAAHYHIHENRLRKIVIGGDNDNPTLLLNACKDCHVLVHEATYTADVAEKMGSSFGHSSAERVAGFAQTVGIPHVVLTHFSARYQSNPERSPSINDIRGEAERIYSGQLFIAEDFARYRLNRAGEFFLLESGRN